MLTDNKLQKIEEKYNRHAIAQKFECLKTLRIKQIIIVFKILLTAVNSSVKCNS